jgi:hypothetical protein
MVSVFNFCQKLRFGDIVQVLEASLISTKALSSSPGLLPPPKKKTTLKLAVSFELIG